VLSRGYFRKDKKHSFMAVSDGRNILVPPELSGDEPCLIAESVPGAVVMAGKNRIGAASYAIEKFSPDLFILDDGFQHWKIQRDLDIVCVNALNPFGNGCLIPAGILREPLEALERADLVVITSSDLIGDEQLSLLEKEISGYTQAKIITARYVPKGFKRIIDSQLFPIESLRKDKFCALSAIGENSGFKKLLKKYSFNPTLWLDFRDHHWYNLDEIKRIDPALKVVTTTKDAVRLKNMLSQLSHEEAARFYALEIELELANGARIWENKIKIKPRYSSTVTAR